MKSAVELVDALLMDPCAARGRCASQAALRLLELHGHARARTAPRRCARRRFARIFAMIARVTILGKCENQVGKVFLFGLRLPVAVRPDVPHARPAPRMRAAGAGVLARGRRT